VIRLGCKSRVHGSSEVCAPLTFAGANCPDERVFPVWLLASAGLHIARSKKVISVLIVDNDPLVREGWRALLERADDIQVVSEGRDGQEAIELANRFDPDIILMDIRMPRMNGLQATQRIVSKEARTRVLIVSMYDEESMLQQALGQGASGFVTKSDSFGELVMAIHAVHKGQTYLSRTVSPLAASSSGV
jgi:DNA-binding NarL/FixJ family response regulator